MPLSSQTRNCPSDPLVVYQDKFVSLPAFLSAVGDIPIKIRQGTKSPPLRLFYVQSRAAPSLDLEHLQP